MPDRLHRFFVAPEAISDGIVTIRGEDSRQLCKVLRLHLGTQIVVLNGSGMEHVIELTRISNSESVGQIISSSMSSGEPKLKMTIVQGLPKGDKMDYIIQKCTELGASQIFPVATKRAVVQLDDKKASERLVRWRRIAKEAAEQSGRGKIPVVGGFALWAETIKAITATRTPVFILWEHEAVRGFFESVSKLAYTSLIETGVAVCIGPEGGLDESEVGQALSLGAISTTLGSRILRTETAGPTAVACAMAASGDLP